MNSKLMICLNCKIKKRKKNLLRSPRIKNLRLRKPMTKRSQRLKPPRKRRRRKKSPRLRPSKSLMKSKT